MAKDLLYRPDLSYEKNYYTDGTVYDFNEDTNINSQDSTDSLNNKLDNINDLLNNITSKLPVIPTDLLEVFLPPFLTVNDVLKDIINKPDDVKPIPIPPYIPPTPIPIPIPPPIDPMPDPDLPPPDPFGREEDIYIDVKPGSIPVGDLIDREYIKDLTDVLEDYLVKYNNVLDKYIANVITSLSLSEFSSLDMIATTDLKDKSLSHISDYLIKSKIGLRQQLNLYSKMFDIDETIFHLRSVKIANEQRKRYRTNTKLKDENTLTKSANDLLRESILVAEKKYEENFYGLYKYLNSSVILFNECTNTITKQKQALVLLNNREREK